MIVLRLPCALPLITSATSILWKVMSILTLKIGLNNSILMVSSPHLYPTFSNSASWTQLFYKKTFISLMLFLSNLGIVSPPMLSGWEINCCVRFRHNSSFFKRIAKTSKQHNTKLSC